MAESRTTGKSSIPAQPKVTFVRKSRMNSQQNHSLRTPNSIQTVQNSPRNGLLGFSSILFNQQRRLEQSIPKSSNTIQTTKSSISHCAVKIVPRNPSIHSTEKIIPNLKEKRDGKTESIQFKEQASSRSTNPSELILLSPKKDNQQTILDEKTSKRQHSTLFNQTKPVRNQQNKNNQKHKRCANRCSPSLLFFTVLISLLLLAGIITAIVVGILSASRSAITSITSTTTSVTVTSCSALCSNERWSFTSSFLIRWTFDNTFIDTTNTYNLTTFNNPSFSSAGYVNQALQLNAASSQSLRSSYIPLAKSSFTIEAWIQPSTSSNLIDQSILGLCPSLAAHQCLHLVIRKNASNNFLYFGFSGDDCQGNTSLTLNRWMHVAFVFDLSSLTQSIYLNGRLDGRCMTSSAFLADQGDVTIGVIPVLIPRNNLNYYQGLIDHVTITLRAKSSCEVMEDATLAACFLFDSPSALLDGGPNNLLSVNNGSSILADGHSGQGISFTNISYLQISSFTGFGMIMHLSSVSSGLAWCIGLMSIGSTGEIILASWDGTGVTIRGGNITLTPNWSHLAQTWSQTNGLRLYLNGTLIASLPSFTSFSGSGASNFVTLANSLGGTNFCYRGTLGNVVSATFQSDMDDFRVYSRELTSSEISIIMQS